MRTGCSLPKDILADYFCEVFLRKNMPYRLVRNNYKDRLEILCDAESIEAAVGIVASDSLDGDGELFGAMLEQDGEIVLDADQMYDLSERMQEWWLGYKERPDIR